ncbi:MAG: heavy metal sensor histidine kinase [Actinomycetota bacterium]
MKPVREWGRSIAGRLTIWFATTTLLLLLAKSLATYWTLGPGLARQDMEFVDAWARLLSAEVKGMSPEAQPWALGGLHLPATPGTMVRIIAPDGRPIYQTVGVEDELPVIAEPMSGRPAHAVGRSGVSYWVATHTGASGITVQVAVEAHEARLLLPSKGRMWGAVVVALVLCGVAGYRIARHGVRPLQSLAESVRAIGANCFEPRIDICRLPIELRPLGETFNGMLDRLRQSFERVSRFSDDIAHELRTPLAIMAGQIDVALEAGRSAEEYREVLESTREEISALSALVERLLFLSRIENHSVSLTVQHLDLAAELQAIREFYDPLAAEAGVLLVVDAPEVGTCVPADRLLLRRVLGNLVVNSVRHTPAGGRVTLSAMGAGSWVRVSVSDTGCGIPPEHLPKVSDRFFRLDPAREAGDGHVGLGLAIAKAIVDLHQGRMEIASTVGEGTEVTILLPDG